MGNEVEGIPLDRCVHVTEPQPPCLQWSAPRGAGAWMGLTPSCPGEYVGDSFFERTGSEKILGSSVFHAP